MSDQEELNSLKARAKTIGLKFHPAIGLAKLKEKVNDHLSKPAEQVIAEKKVIASTAAAVEQNYVEPVPTSPVGSYASPDTPQKKRETPIQKKARLRKKAIRLIRFRLTCMNPNKKGWTCEQFTTGNSAVGTIKRVIPFNADAWHCEEMLLNMIQDRKFIDYYEIKDKKGRVMKKHRLVKEFAIEILPPLTGKEIENLAAMQHKANNLGD